MGITLLFVSLFGGFVATAAWFIAAHLASHPQR
jgi:hypothetical protein